MGSVPIYYLPEKTVCACRQQIDYSSKAAKAFKKEYKGEALPSHKGYQQLAIILEKEKKFSEAIEVCTQAIKRGGLEIGRNGLNVVRKRKRNRV